jgi:histidyl-tRNA synthetase
MEYPYECAEQTFERYFANAVAGHIIRTKPQIREVFDSWANQETHTSNLELNQELKSLLVEETPWVRDMQEEEVQRKNMGLLFNGNSLDLQLKATLDKLSAMQMPSGAFPWFQGGEYPNQYITQHIVAGVGHLRKIHALPDSAALEIARKAIVYLDKEIAEGTAGVARAYVTNGLWNQVQPVKVWYYAPMFRRDRPQAGRYRQHYQIGFETFGLKDPAVDAELIMLSHDFYQDLGLPIRVHVNSLGNKDERERYKNELVSYYRSKRSYLCEDCKVRLTKNPLRVLDCKESQCQPVKEEAPQILDWLGEESQNHFRKVLEYLDELGIAYQLTPSLVRGLDYYNDTIFEFYINDENTSFSLGGGGRYDGLIDELGGKSTPAAGVGLGVERAILALQTKEAETKISKVPDMKYQLFFAQLGEPARRRALKMINDLRSSDIKIAFNFFKTSLKSQMELANNLGATYVLILGQKEVQDKTIIIRDMESGVQEIIDQRKLEPILRRKLGLEVRE